MTNSQWMLLKRRPLKAVWLAAHQCKRLTKEEVLETDISSSVDKILAYEEPNATYRVLAFLLLGVVKLYSQKVEYLLEDCKRAVETIYAGLGTKKINVKGIKAMHAPRLLISRPRSLELDTFDLQIQGKGISDSGGTNKDITVKDACTSAETRHHSPEKNHHDAGVSNLETWSSIYTPMIHCLSLSSIENVRTNNFSLGDRLDPMELSETDGEEDFYAPFSENQEANLSMDTEGDMHQFNNEEHVVTTDSDVNSQFTGINCSDTAPLELLDDQSPVVREVGSSSRRRRRDFDVNSRSTGINHSDTAPQELLDAQSPVFREAGNRSDTAPSMLLDVQSLVVRETESSSRRRRRDIDVNSQSTDINRSDTSPLVLLDVQSPVVMKAVSSSRRRKRIRSSVDEVKVHSNKLRRERLKVSRTPLHARKRQTSSILPHTLAESSCPGPLVELHSPITDAKSGGNSKVTQMENLETPSALSQPASWASYDEPEIFEGGPASPFESIAEEQYPSEEETSRTFLNDEEVNSKGVNQEGDGWSNKTRIIGSQLGRCFLSQKKISLWQTLEGKTKSECSRFFYETLVLKSNGYIDVEQDEAHGDIIVMETPKLNQAYKCGTFD